MIWTLAELGIANDPGRAWHPDDPAKFAPDGTLPDLTDTEVAEHRGKPEAALAEPLLAAEDSSESPEGVI